MSGFFAAIGTELLHLVLPALATAIAGLAIALLKKQLAKVNLDLTDAQASTLEALVRKAILAAQEAARRNPSMTGSDKAAAAAAAIQAARPDLSPAQVQAAIDAALPPLRATGILVPPLKPAHPVPSTPGTFGR